MGIAFGSARVIAGSRVPRGYQQILTATLASATSLTIPTSPTTAYYAVIQCEGTFGTDYVRWRDDGVAPTSTVGMILNGGQEIDTTTDLATIQFIVGAGAPILNISYYTG